MQERDTNSTEPNERQQRPIQVDRLLFVFLLVGWLLIFLFATLGLYRANQDWLPINPVVRAAADYGVDAQDAPRLAQVKPEIVEAVKQDAKNREALKTPTPLTDLLDITPTTTVSPTVTPTLQAPLTVNVGGPYEGEEGSAIALEADDFNSILGIIPRGVSYLWDLNGDGLYDDADGPTASVTFLDEGDYPISVKAIDLLRREAIDTTVANVINVAPTIQIGEDLYTSEGRTAYFAATATDPGRDVLFYQWDFGDGSVGVNNTLRPQHIFEDNGEYEVTLRVRDNDGGVSAETLVAYVGNLPPDVDAGPDQTVDEGSPLTLRGDATDPGVNDELSFAWDLDYDGNDFSPDIDGEQVTTTYPDGPADIVAALGVSDEDGGEEIDTVNITVNNVPPVFTGVSDSGPVGEGVLLNITISATDVGADTLTYAFDWDNDGTYDTVQASNSAANRWYNQGQHRVGLRVDDGDGGEIFSSTVVSTFNLTPTAIAQVPSSTYFEGSSVPFNGSESSDPGINDTLTYAWDFGDGSSGSGVNPVHTYTDNEENFGVYTVTLTVADDSGAVDQDSVSVLVLNANPTADAVLIDPSDGLIDEDEPTITVSSNVSDPGGNEIVSVEWDFDYDGVTFDAQASGETATYTYPELDGPEEKIVALRVRDKDYPAPTNNGGEVGEFIDTFKLFVENQVPKNIDTGGPYKGIVTEPITITARTADDVDGDTLTYEWDLDYDGNFNRDVTGQTIVRTWDSAGLYDIALRVVDDDGDQSEVEDTTVNVNAVPIADAGGPYSGREGSLILFDGSGSVDPDGDELLYTWNFGDGTTNQTNITTTHIFTDNGIYTTTLFLEDIDGDIDTDVVTATIFNANPVIASLPNRTVDEGKPLTLTGSASDPGAGDTLAYAWDFDYDGATFDVDATGTNITTTYLNGPAVYTVALRVRDDDYPYQNPNGGQIGQALRTFQVTVNNVAPIAEAGGPYYNVEDQPITLTGTGQDVAGDTLTYAWDLNGDGTFETPGRVVNNTWADGGNYTVTLQVTDSDGSTGTDTAAVEVNFKPTVVFVNEPYGGSEAVPITVDGSASFDPDDTDLIYTWDFGDGTPPASGTDATHAYLDNGTYTAVLTVSDQRGGVGTAQATVTIANTPPTVVIGGPYSGNEEESITFDGRGSKDISPNDTLSYSWNFGDGKAAVTSGPLVNYAYDDNGTYTVTLRVTDDDGGTSSITTTAAVANLDPTAEAGGPYRTTTDVAVTLTGSGTDVAADTLTFEWDLDGDGTFERAGQNINNTWTTPGSKTVALRVTDDDGGFATDTATVDVGEPPVADAGGPYTTNENSSIKLDGSASSDPDGDPLTYTWDFGDGSPPATGAVVNHTYVDDGTYVATLTVEDGRGGVDTAQANVAIDNVAPTARFDDPGNNPEGQEITFDGSRSSDPGPNDTLTYLWDFGDGATASGATVSHQFDDNGDFNVELTVTDKDGDSDSTSKTITITNAPPTANAGGPYSGDEGTTINFDGSGSKDPSPDDTLTYEWDFGDGNTSTDQNPTHTYDDDGDYTVELTVTDDDGGSRTDTVTVAIANVDPTADAGGPYNTTPDTAVTLSGDGTDILADPLTFEWDLDDDGDFESEGQSVDFTRSTTGTYTVVLRVSDDDGGSTTDSTTVEVNSLLPLAWLSLPFTLAGRRKRRSRKNVDSRGEL